MAENKVDQASMERMKKRKKLNLLHILLMLKGAEQGSPGQCHQKVKQNAIFILVARGHALQLGNNTLYVPKIVSGLTSNLVPWSYNDNAT